MSATFLTFPLCLLSMPMDWKERMEHIISHAMQRAGRGDGAQEIGADKIGAMVAENKAQGYKHGTDHDAIIRGSIILNDINPGSLQNIVCKCSEVSNYVAKFESKHGKDALVFIASELFWGCHNESNPTYREFSTLCALNSIIAYKEMPILIRRAMIQARQLGYKSPAVMEAELGTKSKADRQTPLTIQQLRDVLDKLEARKFFCRVQAPSMKSVYFSTTLTREELRAAVLERWKAKGWLKAARAEDRAMFRMQAGTTKEPLKKEEPRENHLKRKTSKQAKKEPLKKEEPSENHIGTTKGTTTGTTEINASQEMLQRNASQYLLREKEIAAAPEVNGKSRFAKMRAECGSPPPADDEPPMPETASNPERQTPC